MPLHAAARSRSLLTLSGVCEESFGVAAFVDGVQGQPFVGGAF